MDHNEEELTNILKTQSPYRNDLHKKTRGWSRCLLLTGIASTFGIAVVGGYNIGVINAPAEYMKAWANETIYNKYEVNLSVDSVNLLWSFIVSIFLVGGAIGSLGGSYIADRIGRKGSYLTCAILFIIGAFCFQFCRALSSVELLCLGRFFVGLASGMTTTCLPMYLTEIAPLQLRGTLGVLCSMGFTGGVVVGQIFSLQEIFGTEDLWHYALSFYAVLVIICTLPYRYFPESPKYLYLVAGDREGAIRELKKLCENDELLHDEIEEMNSKGTDQQPEEKRNILSILKDPSLLLPIILVCSLQGGQQLSGINAVFYYSVMIFESIGLSSVDAKWANLGAGCVNLFVSFFSPMLMEKVNRRPLSLLSCGACAFMLILLTFVLTFVKSYAFLPIICVIALFGYIIFYQLGLGPIPFFIGSELFEVAPRSAAMSLGSLSSWSCNFIVGMTFPTLQSAIGPPVFLIFASVCIMLTVLLKMYLPETRGKDTTDVAALVAKGFRSKPI
ncbi:unnamed protein product, partial [Diamesa tonsa]